MKSDCLQTINKMGYFSWNVFRSPGFGLKIEMVWLITNQKRLSSQGHHYLGLTGAWDSARFSQALYGKAHTQAKNSVGFHCCVLWSIPKSNLLFCTSKYIKARCPCINFSPVRSLNGPSWISGQKKSVSSRLFEINRYRLDNKKCDSFQKESGLS